VAQADLVFPLGDAGAGLVALADEAALGEAVEGGSTVASDRLITGSRPVSWLQPVTRA
jgi:hypothetical protein